MPFVKRAHFLHNRQRWPAELKEIRSLFLFSMQRKRKKKHRSKNKKCFPLRAIRLTSEHRNNCYSCMIPYVSFRSFVWIVYSISFRNIIYANLNTLIFVWPTKCLMIDESRIVSVNKLGLFIERYTCQKLTTDWCHNAYGLIIDVEN